MSAKKEAAQFTWRYRLVLGLLAAVALGVAGAPVFFPVGTQQLF